MSTTFAERSTPQVQHVDQKIASDSVPPSHPVKEQQVFAPRSVGSLSRRGLAPPADVDDDPSIVVPLAAYAEDNPRTIAFRILAAVLLLVVIGTVWFMVNRGYASVPDEPFEHLRQGKANPFPSGDSQSHGRYTDSRTR